MAASTPQSCDAKSPVKVPEFKIQATKAEMMALAGVLCRHYAAAA